MARAVYKKFYSVEYKGKTRLETLYRGEAEDHARSLWKHDNTTGTPPQIFEHATAPQSAVPQ